MGTQQPLAVVAFVVELTDVRGHGFLFGKATMRARQHRFKNDGAHSGVTLNGGGIIAFVVATFVSN
jgi:hypothetical protein